MDDITGPIRSRQEGLRKTFLAEVLTGPIRSGNFSLMTNSGHTLTVGQTVTYIGGRVKFKITAVAGIGCQSGNPNRKNAEMSYVYDHCSTAADVQVGWKVNDPGYYRHLVVEWVRRYDDDVVLGGLFTAGGGVGTLKFKANDPIVAQYEKANV